MNIYLTYGIIFVILLLLELAYFKIAAKCDIIDKPNERSSHSTIVLRGGGIIFTLSTLIWCGLKVAHGDWELVIEYLPFLCALILIAIVSLVDDIRSLPYSVRLVAQFLAMNLMFYNLDMMHLELWWIVILALIVCVGATNVINFMDGVNGITAGYSLAVLIPLAVFNGSESSNGFVDQSFLITAILGVLVFCLFNFRPKGKAKCFAGDVGSIGIAFIMLFAIGKLVMQTQDITWVVFLVVYLVDGVLTICHRIMLRENLGKAHRKHAYQLMANELKIGHVKVSSFYALLQLVVSLAFIYLCPNTKTYHWMFLIGIFVVLSVAYILLKKKYYPLHEKYLASLKK
ncbi:MraY family glycosyltransferase [Bacteroides pyogenes]|uniref:MraY family glycosyltransferase n=1 Tax=Bacteroides pyogenes TaxID=310300 RepID=UPI001BAA1E38|nr:glycosyltransferase family 4 protein [Bacteroides pyogenes]MBR8706874.1 Undecaprenyl-phosphate alpha-N-acetylglucosaminyl 1-phosphate transferase [Bacteroides pyogenes]